MWSEASWFHLQCRLSELGSSVAALQCLMASQGREGLSPEQTRQELIKVETIMEYVWAPVHWDTHADAV